MSEQAPQRRLAAILVADVVGYSRMMQADEAGTLAALKSRRTEILQPLVSKHHGRIIKVMGDGVLVEFASAVSAVQCGVDLQQAMAASNRGLSDDRQIMLRIGINLGDVMVEGGDLYGDGVNIAARLEGIAEPGGIVVSSTAHDHVRNKVKTTFEDMGAQTLKNIAEPIRTYRVASKDVVAATVSKPMTNKPSIAVLPFANMSGDPDQGYFSDGLTEDIITELSRSHSLVVIARNSSFQYRDKAADIKRVARELDVDYIVEGSVRRAGERVRISAQLIDASTGGHVWAQHYDRSMLDVFTIQDELTTAIAAKVVGHVQVAGINKVRRMRTDSMAAYDLFLRSLEHFNHAGGEDTIPARQYVERAIEMDPDFALAHAALAASLVETYWDENFKDKKTATLDDALRVARRAVALDNNDAQCHCILAYVQMARKSFNLALHHLDIALQLNPNDADALSHRATVEVFTGKPEQSLKTLQEAMRLNPVLPNWYREIEGVALYQLGRYAEAARALEKATALRPYAMRYLAACYAQSDRVEDAQALTAEVLRLDRGFRLSAWAKIEPYESAKDLEHMREGMRKAGLPE
jgi:TolB-like protein/Tfp pilus assembly protein PilF